MIPTFIPSKDRASQLLLLLESLDKNAPNMFQPHIMYKSSNEDFAKGYDLVKNNNAGKDCMWAEEDSNDGERQFYEFLESNRDDLVCLFSDDCIFYRQTDMSEKDIKAMMSGGSIWTFTFRLGRNISIRDYVDQRKAQHPEFIGLTEKYFFWDWSTVDFWDMFGFACGFDGYLYRAQDLLDLSERSHFDGRICFWEKMICQKFNEKKTSRISMAAPILSNVFVQQINTVHSYGHRTNHTFNFSAQSLNEYLLDGHKIDLSSMDFSNVNCTHGELKFEFMDL